LDHVVDKVLGEKKEINPINTSNILPEIKPVDNVVHTKPTELREDKKPEKEIIREKEPICHPPVAAVKSESPKPIVNDGNVGNRPNEKVAVSVVKSKEALRLLKLEISSCLTDACKQVFMKGLPQGTYDRVEKVLKDDDAIKIIKEDGLLKSKAEQLKESMPLLFEDKSIVF